MKNDAHYCKELAAYLFILPMLEEGDHDDVIAVGSFLCIAKKIVKLLEKDETGMKAMVEATVNHAKGWLLKQGMHLCPHTYRKCCFKEQTGPVCLRSECDDDDLRAKLLNEARYCSWGNRSCVHKDTETGACLHRVDGDEVCMDDVEPPKMCNYLGDACEHAGDDGKCMLKGRICPQNDKYDNRL
jgi:hypothetical protein